MGSLPAGLFRQSSGIYKYRRRVPDKLKGLTIGGVKFPAFEWIMSLGTRDPAQARALHRERDAEIRALIEEAELTLAGPAGLEEATQAREARLAAEAAARARAQRYAARAPARIALRQRLDLSSGELTVLEAAARDLIREAKDASPDDYRAAQAILEAGAETIGGKTLGQTVRLYSERVVATKAQSTIKSNGTAFAFLCTVLGDDKRIRDIDREAARKVLSILHMQPSNQWAGRGLSPYQRAALAERDGLTLLSSKAITDSYLSFWSALFGYAAREEWIARNPFEGLAREVNGRETKRRLPFTSDELGKLFGAAPWTPANSAPSGKPIRYWGPLLALYHGLRRGEVASLRADGFRDEGGIVVFDIAGTKTENAERRHALHPELLRLGLFDLAKNRADKGMLFDGEAMDARGMWGDAFGDWFSRHRKSAGIGVNGQGLHSLRHNWEDALREADLHQTPIGQYLGGRAALDPVGGGYGIGYSATKLHEAISKVAYPDLTLERGAGT